MGLLQRQKGDIYWEKRMCYLRSAKEKGNMGESFFSQDVAEDVVEACKNGEGHLMRVISGDEFDFSAYPPTAAGHRAFTDTVAAIKSMNEELDQILNAREEYREDFIWEKFREGFEKRGSVLEETVRTYLNASGIDEAGEPIADKDVIHAAREEFPRVKRQYEETVHSRMEKFRSAIIKEISDRAGLEIRKSVEGEIRYEPFERLLETDPEMTELYKEELEQMRRIIEQATRLEAEWYEAREVLKQVFWEEYLKKPEGELRRQLLLAAFLDYRHDIDMKIKGAIYSRQICMYYVGYLLLDRPVDPIMLEHISRYLKREPRLLEEEILESIDGFLIPEEPSEEGEDRSLAYEHLMERGESIQEYMALHPGKFDVQCLLSIATGNEGLGDFCRTARLLSADIDDFTKTPEAKEMDRHQWFSLLDLWVIVECGLRISYILVDFLSEHSEDTVKTASDALREILPEISRFDMEKDVRKALRKLAIERSGVHVPK